MSTSRSIALEVLEKVLSRDERPKAALDRSCQGIDRRDRDFIMEVVYGVLRYTLTMDWMLEQLLTGPSRLHRRTLINLRIALYQLFFMRVPEHAVVYEAVEMEKSLLQQGKPDVVNAVLRNCLRQRERFRMPFHFEDPLQDISVNTSHPRWLVSRWTNRFGLDEASSLARANNEIPSLTLRVNTLKISREHLLEKLLSAGFAAHVTKYSPDGITVEGRHSFGDLSFARGLFAIQDEASQLISFLIDPRAGEVVLDACAAPGGKTTHIAQLMSDSGTVVAVDRDEERVSRIRENTEMLGIRSVKPLSGDALHLDGTAPFDRILLDAPCSSLGVIRRNPDVKYRHSRKTLRDFSRKQIALLLSMPAHLKADGRIVYSVCSTEPEEGEDVIEAFLKRNTDFRIIDAEQSPARIFQRDGIFRTFPHRDGMDGFFGVILCRKKYPFS